MPLDQYTEDNDEKEMSFWDHLEDLRWHLIRIVAVLAVGMVVFFIYIKEIIEFVILKPFSKDFFINQLMCKLNESMCFEKMNVSFQATDPYEQFTKAIFISIVGGFIVAFPYIFWEIWRFIKPALHTKEIKGLRGVVFFVSLLFFLGVAFGYFIICPLTVWFLTSFQLASDIQNIWKIGSVIAMIAQISLAGGIVFQFPVLCYFLAKIGFISSAFMRSNRRYAVIAILVIAGILTPSPDPYTQLFMAIPMYLLFEIGILIVKRVEKKDKEYFEIK